MINLKFQYKQLFAIKINHNYYSNESINDLYIVPTGRTIKLIEKMAMLIRNKDGEMHVLFDASKLDRLYHKLINSNGAESKLSFMIYSKNQYFTSITDIPIDISGKIFYFSNKELGNNNSGVLHKSEYVNAKDLFNTSTQEINNDQDSNINYKIALENGELKDEMPVINLGNTLQVDMSKLIDGRYNVFGNETELMSFINIGPKTKGSPVGFIDIFINKNLKEKLIEEIESGEVSGYKYSINFNSRSIFWKYLIIPTYIKRVKELNISCQKGKEKLSFKKLAEDTIDDKRVMSFISDEPIKFKQFYDYEIQLKKKESDSGGKTIIKKMPYAGFDLLKPTEGNRYMSEIYVYI